MLISNEKLLLFQKETTADPELQLIISYVRHGLIKIWPYKDLLPANLQFYYSIKNDLFIANHLLRKQMLNLIHSNHFGIEKSKSRVRQVLFWPYLNKEIEDIVKNCRGCGKSKIS